MIRSVIQANVLEIVVAILTFVFEGRRLENRHADCTANPRSRFTTMNQFSFDVFRKIGHLVSPASCYAFNYSFLELPLANYFARTV